MNIPDESAERIELEPTEALPRRSLPARMAPLLIPLVILGVLAMVYLAFLKPRGREPSAEKAAAVRAPTPEVNHKPPEFGEVYSISDIIINPADGRRHFMVTVSLEYQDKDKLAEIQRRESLLRDNLITFFSSQPVEVLTNIRYRQAIRSRVKKIMDYQLGDGVVSRIFFDKWIFQ